VATVDDLLRLPLHGHGEESAEQSSCDMTKVYISLEEKSILADIRALRDRAVDLRMRLDAAETDEQRTEIGAQLGQLREQRKELGVRREAAYTRKMIMLGHLPPDVELL
jgi:hypothetical protein